MVYDTVDGKNNQLEKTMEVAGIRIYHYGWNFFQKGCDMLCVVMVVEMKTVSSFNISDNIKVLCVGGWRHCGWQGQLDGGDHGDIMMYNFS